MKKSVLFIIIGVVVVVFVGVAVVLFLKPQQQGEQTGTPTSVKKEQGKETFYTPGEAFVTNVKDSEVLLRASVVLQIGSEKEQEFLDKNVAVIRDIILFTLRNYNEKEMRNSDIQQTLSDVICQRLNERFEVNFFQQAYFTDLVVQ